MSMFILSAQRMRVPRECRIRCVQRGSGGAWVCIRRRRRHALTAARLLWAAVEQCSLWAAAPAVWGLGVRRGRAERVHAGLRGEL